MNGPMIKVIGPMTEANGPMIGVDGPTIEVDGGVIEANGPMIETIGPEAETIVQGPTDSCTMCISSRAREPRGASDVVIQASSMSMNQYCTTRAARRSATVGAGSAGAASTMFFASKASSSRSASGFASTLPKMVQVGAQATPCPTCGAPLRLQGAGALSLVCHYCNTPLRITAERAEGAQTVAADPTLSREAIARIKELLMSGSRGAAVEMYAREAKCEPKAASDAIASWIDTEAFAAVQRARLNALGVMATFVSVAVIVAGLVLGLQGEVPAWAAWTMGAVGLLLAFMTVPRFPRTVRYLGATKTTATIVRSAFVGPTTYDKRFFHLLLQVREPSGATFEVERAMVFWPRQVGAITVGRVMRVKYFPGDPQSVVYEGDVEGR